MRNLWGTFSSSLALWYAEFPPTAWRRWVDLHQFVAATLDAGRREDIAMTAAPARLWRDHNLLGRTPASTRVSVHGPAGIDERVTADLGTDLLSLRPDLKRVPRMPALELDGPAYVNEMIPVYAMVSISTDIWFPQVVGINELDDNGEASGYDNSELAARHTPRFNRFLTDVRAAVEGAGGRWDYDIGPNPFYARQVDENGISLA